MSSESRTGRASRRVFLGGVGAAGAGLLAGSVGAGPAAAEPAVRPLSWTPRAMRRGRAGHQRRVRPDLP